MGESLRSDETNNEATELSNLSGEAHEVTEPVSNLSQTENLGRELKLDLSRGSQAI